MKYTVTLPEDQGRDSRSFARLGVFYVGHPRVVDLSDTQAASLKGKGMDVVPLLLDLDEPLPLADDEPSGYDDQDKE